MTWLGNTLGSAVGGASSMFPTIGKAVGAGWALNAVRELDPYKKKKRRTKRK